MVAESTPRRVVAGLPLALVVSCLVSLVGLAFAAEEPAKKEQRPATKAKASKPAAETVAYGNEDLERLFGKVEPTEPEPTGAPSAEAEPGPPAPAEPGGAAAEESGRPDEPADPLAAVLEQRDRQKERAGEVAEAQAKLGEAQDRVARLERRIRAIRNPLLARPEAPEGQQDWTTIGAREQLERTEEELVKAREEVTLLERAVEERRGSS